MSEGRERSQMMTNGQSSTEWKSHSGAVLLPGWRKP